MRPEPVVGVLLAAGAGRRLGHGPKALLSFDGEPGESEGQPQVVRMVRALLRGGCEEAVVVLGAGSDRVRQVLRQSLGQTPGQGSYRTVVNEAWESGIGSSFRVGVETAGRLLAGDRGGCLMVALVDQPDIDEAVVAHLRAVASGRRVRAAGFPDAAGRLVRGHPIVFPVAMARAAAERAAGDVAGRTWLRAHPELVEVVDVGHLATGRDVDTHADLLRWSAVGEDRGRDSGQVGQVTGT